MSKDYYKVLGVTKESSQDEIKNAYYNLAHKHHPDKNGDPEKFKEINEAYKILSDKDKKAQYDRFGYVNDGQSAGHGYNAGGFDFNFSDAGDLGDIFSQFFGGQAGFGQRKEKGGDIKVDLVMDLKDTLSSSKKKIKVNKYIKCNRCNGNGAEPGTDIDKCPACNGRGKVQTMHRTPFGTFTQLNTCPECRGEGYKPKTPCNVCNGEGIIKGEEDIDVLIPAGVDSGQIFSLSQRGNVGRRNTEAGDLYIRVIVNENKDYKREGDDLYFTQNIPFSTAILGGKTKFMFLDNKNIELKIPKNTQSGEVFKNSKKGIPHFSKRGVGDLYVKIMVQTPEKINKEQKKLIEELQKQGL